MSSLVNKLISLNLHEQAIKELRILKKRLETLPGVEMSRKGTAKTTPASANEAKNATQVFAELMDFGEIKASGQALQLIITTQIQILRILAAGKKSSWIEVAVPFLRQDKHTSTSSAINLLLAAAAEPGADPAKIARQLDTVSTSLLAMTPSASAKDDNIALEPRLSVSPASALELQALTLESRMHWWKLAKHKGDVERDLMLPLSKYIAAYIRRSREDGVKTYISCNNVFTRVFGQIQQRGLTVSKSSKYPLAGICQSLITLARDSKLYDEAIKFGSKLLKLLDPTQESVAKICSVTAQLLALQLKDPAMHFTDNTFLDEVLAGIRGPMKGDSAELDELLTNVCLLRQSAMKLLLSISSRINDEGAEPLPPFLISSRQPLETLVLQVPHFTLRWLGKPPDPKASTKEYLRYEQRRQLVLQQVQHSLDSAFVTVKTKLEEGRLEWERMDSVLNDCLTLLDFVGDMNSGPERTTTGSSNHVKISHFYFLQYNMLRQQQQRQQKQRVNDDAGKKIDPVAPFRALRRSVECLKHRSTAEKQKGQLVLKLERLAELAKTLGRTDQALGAYQAVRTSLLEDGVLLEVARLLDTQSPYLVWTKQGGDNTKGDGEMLSRTLCSIAKLESVWIDWTVDLQSEKEQAAALEHRLLMILLPGLGTSKNEESREIGLEHAAIDSLLRIYIPTRYPIRRLRVLLALLSASIGSGGGKVAELLAITRDAAQLDGGETDMLGEDVGLASFLPHMKAYYYSLTGLADGFKNVDLLKQSINTWKSSLEKCQTKADLEMTVDDIPGLLDHLQSVGDFLRMKGMDRILASVLEISAEVARLAEGPRTEDVVHHNASLALQYTCLGQSIKAEQVFSKALEYAVVLQNDSHEVAAAAAATAEFHLSFTEHFLATGNLSKAEEHLMLAREAVGGGQDGMNGAVSMLQRVSRAKRKYLIAYAAYLHSVVALERGDSHLALIYSRESVRSIFQDWLRLESLAKASATARQLSSVSAVSSPDTSMADDGGDQTVDMSAVDATRIVSQTTAAAHASMPACSGPEIWKLAPFLYRNIIRLSSVYAHLGMFQETLYYAEQAHKVATSISSELYMADCAAWMGSLFVRAAKPQMALDMLREASQVLPEDEDRSFASAALACRMSAMYLDLKNTEGAAAMVKKAEVVVESLAALAVAAQTQPVVGENVKAIEQKMAKLKLDAAPPAKPTRGTRKATTTARAAPVRRATKTGAKTKATAAAAVMPKKVQLMEDARVAKLRAQVLIQKAASMLDKRDWATALATLGEARGLTKSPSSLLPAEQVAMAACLLGMSMDQMAHDPVFSVIQDSTISFPAVSSSSVEASDRPSSTASGKVTPPPKKTRGVAASKEMPSKYVDHLREAQEYLLEAHAIATVSSDASLVHKISGMLQNVSLLLAATSSAKKAAPITASSNTPHTAYSVELARNLTWRRERKALALEKNTPKFDGSTWPVILDAAANPRRTSLGFSLDLHRFQRDYVDIIPRSWNVISISLSDNKHDLCITKMAAGQTPFVLRLPLERASSRDADNAVFNFQQGRAELLEIIDKTNETCHDARDFSVKGAKTAWWADRQELDNRLKDLLENVEQIWLGGFRGVFSQHVRHEKLLEKFEADFVAVLDKHLPSRRVVARGRGKKAAAPAAGAQQKVNLDPRVLELFIGLGDATATGSDFDEELTDLLYFVVDILQFHGERNAYDEIDFDHMVVETFDALQAYHAAVKAEEKNKVGSGDAEDRVHTVLLLDKALHVFPWESLPCLQGLAVSRMPSLGCLRRLIVERRKMQQKQQKQKEVIGQTAGCDALPQDGHHVSAASGTYILNPSADLKTTEKWFQPPLEANLPRAADGSGSAWKRVVGRAPTEEEFEQALTESDIMLYFGHGSGAQYIRGRTIRRLDRCRATVMLMGCSSAKLIEAGDFEVSGPAWNYMMAGCPAVVGTLWDVTDKDIDRFAGRVFEEWGLVPKGTFVEGKEESGGAKGGGGKGRKREVVPVPARRDDDDEDGKKLSLVEAVAKAREGACRFRYVTAAAVAVYGIPVYVGK